MYLFKFEDKYSKNYFNFIQIHLVFKNLKYKLKLSASVLLNFLKN